MSEYSTLHTKSGVYTLLKKIYESDSTQMHLSLKEMGNKSRKFFIIKSLNHQNESYQDCIETFLREGEIITSLSHHNIIHGYDFGDGSIANTKISYIATDYIPGKSLAQITRDTQGRPLPVAVTCQVIQSVAQALTHTHTYRNPVTGKARPVIHRDISPDNILLGYNGDIALIDFGIAVTAATPLQPELIHGKPGYMSPEQRNNEPLSLLTDIYSLGVVFWECLTGRKMVSKDIHDTERIKQIPHPPHPSEHNLAAPKVLGDICMKCLENEPSRRLQSAQEMLHVLQNQHYFAIHGRPVIREYLCDAYREEMEQQRAVLMQYLEDDDAVFRPHAVSAELEDGITEKSVKAAPQQEGIAETTEREVPIPADKPETETDFEEECTISLSLVHTAPEEQTMKIIPPDMPHRETTRDILLVTPEDITMTA